MLLERIYDEDLAQASYLIGCQAEGKALVVDPRRDHAVYERIATAHGMTITGATETHIHADYLSGTRELARATGAQMYVSDEGGPDWTYGTEFDGATRMKNGHRIQLGNITVEAVHTPGHTPEHMSFLITDGAQADKPGFMLTGDFVFVGEVGRPDLLDAAAGGVDTRFRGAQDLFLSLRDVFLTLPDYVQVLPGHGSGSACGKSLGAVPTTTVGYERTFSWWAPFLAEGDMEGFVDHVLSDQPDPHAYFARMKVENRTGPVLLPDAEDLVEHSAESLTAAMADDTVILLDTRGHGEVHAGTVKGSLTIPGLPKSASFASWIVDPAREKRSIVVLAADADEASAYRDHLRRVGIDSVTGYISSLDGLALTPPEVIEPEDLDAALTDGGLLLDVRNSSEYTRGHLPGAVNLSGGRVMWHLHDLPTPGTETLYTYCQAGLRNAVVSSALRRAGHEVVEIKGSYSAWAALDGSVPATTAT
ncbi:MBL fold metallo-hydrolase [Brevibacterium litoralis]|uniref:MBL fold metallo-hydrolase n=1 Tax=Brevibacterium litoralis TaxID=3138935 RepID=UPI0032EB9B77